MFFDTHTHLDFLAKRTSTPLGEIVLKAKEAGVEKMLLTAVEASQFHDLYVKMAPFACHLYLGLGLHPLWIEKHQQQDLDTLAFFLRQGGVKAVAEIGLDRHLPALNQGVMWQKQQDFCLSQLQLANEFKLPVSLHSRQSHAELLALLKCHSPAQKGVIHGFSGSFQQAKQFVDLGYFIGVGGSITYPRANKTRQTMAKLPLDCLVLETDSPDMPLWGKQGQANFPHYLPIIFRHLCELKGLRGEHQHLACQRLWANALQLFGEE